MTHATAHPAGPGAPWVRKLFPLERQAAIAHLLRLDPEDRQRRFLVAMSDEAVRAYGANLFAPGTIVLGAFCGRTLVGLAELRPTGRPAEAEFAVSVERAAQGRGTGTELVRRIAEIARNRGLRTLHCICLPSNAALQRIVRRLGAHLHWTDGAIEADLVQRWPSPWSVLSETLADGAAVLHHWAA
jgi:RimJ/RimL family protein N-acetyltransferase